MDGRRIKRAGYQTGRMVLNMSKLPQLGRLGMHC
jgi:hypothetical protein